MSPLRLSSAGAVGWCAVFACLHFYWAVGGSVGLSSSAGRELARTRPAGFVALGLYGVAVLLGLAGLLAIVAASDRAGPRSRSWSIVLVGAVGVILFLRGALLEVVLVADLGGVREQIGALETRWSLVLWNPWFVVGGVVFLLHAWTCRSRRCANGR